MSVQLLAQCLTLIAGALALGVIADCAARWIDAFGLITKRKFD